uniref:Titin n=1 Tax=Anser brachyrhynchus TaxID=132585 RepID=A0A8B9BGE9_9AVES
MPLIDGGSRITNYIVEKRESTRKAYSTVTTNCQKCSFRIPNLVEGCEYYFRVLAENEFGIGEPAETAEPVRASEAPSPPESLNIMDVTRNSVSLAWPKPEHDGGSKITGYVIEAQRKGTNQWAHITTVKTLDCIVKNLTENEEYTFQVMAVNSAGRSAPRESRPVIIKEQMMLPEFDLRGIYQKTVIAKAGDNIKIEIPVLGRPRPTVTWKKEDQMLKQTQRVNYENTATATILTINECTRSDSGQYPLSAKNIVGEVSEVITVQVHDIPGPPTGPIKFDEISSDFVTFSWQPPLNDGGVPISNYVVEMRQTDSTTWTELATTVIRTIFKATRLTTGVEYQFRVKAQNRYGIGPAITSESVVANYPFKVPGPPGTPQVTAVTKETMTISWNEPVTDGGSPILGYHVERKERNSILWQTVSKMLVSGNIFKSTGLTDGIAYEFRVIAENLAGKSKPSKPSEPVFALDPIDPPGKPIPLNITRHAVTLKWTKPEYNGGFKITGYTVEKRDLPNGRWLKANFSNILETEFTVSGLTEDAAYEFRVIARNAGGAVSQPSEPSDAITCRDDIEAPKIKVDAKYKDTLVLKAGEVFRLEADVSGRPPPSMTWTKGEKELEDTAKLEIKIADFSTVLINKDSSRRDGGAYTLTATNPGGFAKHIFNVKVLDRPGPPEGPLAASEVTAEKCVLSWLPPLDDGGAKIDHYVVEKRETSRLAWTAVATEVPLTKLKVTKLLKGNEYVFRVMAVNKYGYGIGLPVETSESVKVSERPLPPGKITLLDVTRNSVSLSWEKPEHDGGSRILGYIVEMQSKGSEKWSTCATVKVTEATITGLIQGEEYTFRVSAQNEKGISDPRQLGIPVVAKDLVIPPAFKLLFTTFSVLAGEDLKVDVPFVGRPKPAVFWHKDNVALKQTTRVNAESSENITVLTIKEACREDVGAYLVKLTNSAGEATETLNIVVLDKPGPPTGPVKVDEVTADSITISWEPPKYDGGSSINNYIVEKRDTSTTTWQIVSATVARTTIKACRLKTGCEYQFRITAENRYGKSTYLTSEPISSGAITARDEVEPPHISMDPKYKDTIVVHAGESFKLEADVHGKPIPSIQWLKGDRELTNTARMEIKSTDFVTTISAGLIYEFRVYAENAAGIGKASHPSDPVLAIDACGMYSPEDKEAQPLK